MKLWSIIFSLLVIASCGQQQGNKIIHIWLLHNQLYGHGDLIFQITGLTSGYRFDTYYFRLANNALEDEALTKAAVAAYFEAGVSQVRSMHSGQVKYLPVDLSDEYTGCFKLTRHGDSLSISYGTSSLGGASIDVKNPAAYFNAMPDFKIEREKTVQVLHAEFVNDFTQEVRNLED